ncbi:MAG: nitrilase-related carbon-nitrogen hydrolase [bacterium]
MKIGYLQFEPRLGDNQANYDRVAALLPGAAEADLIVLPELANSGYNFTSRHMAEASAESAEDGPLVSLLTKAAAEHDLHVVAGMNERDGDVLYNSAVLVGPHGLVGKYRKTHLFWNEKDLFAPGDLGLPVFDIGPARIGMLICFDWIFPETWRVLALTGADIVCHPSNLVIPGLCQKSVPVQALCNGVFAITANRIGTEGDLTFTGRSIIADPRGEILAQAPAAKESTAVVEIDINGARDKSITPRNDRLADRRPELYRSLTE